MNLTVTERWILSNQLRILESLYPDEARDLARARKAIERGYELEYGHLSEHVYDPPLTREQCKEVLNILDMFTAMKRSFEALPDKSGIEASRIEFSGFDANDKEEGAYLGYAEYFCKCEWDRRYEELPHAADNSHAPFLPLYRPMLAKWLSQMGKRWKLSREDLIELTETKGQWR